MALHLHHCPTDSLAPEETAGAARIADLCSQIIAALATVPDCRMRAVLACAALETIGDAVSESLGSWGETVQ
jgi:hypothetical protein